MKIKKIITRISALIFALSVALLTIGCNFDLLTIEKIQFIDKPQTTFALNEQLSFKIEAVYTSQSGEKKTVYVKYENNSLSYDDGAGAQTAEIKISGFDTSFTGTRTAKIVYDGLSLSFDYTVIDDDGNFGGGDGTQYNPYLVSTVRHFQNMLNAKSFKFYKITNDIDFTGVVLQSANAGCDITLVNDGVETGGKYPENLKTKAWAGVIDGQIGTTAYNYTLKNLGAATKYNGKPANKDNELFGCIASSTNGRFEMKNLNIEFASTEGYSPVFCIASNNGYDAEISFKNVHISGYQNYGLCGTSWVGVFMNKLDYNPEAPCKSVLFENCTSTVQMMNTYPRTSAVSGFVTVHGKGGIKSLKFKNCTFGGRIEGSGQNSIGVFTTVSNQGTNYTKTPEMAQAYVDSAFKYENCKILSSAEIISNVGDRVYPTVHSTTGTSLTKSGVDVENTIDTSITQLTLTVDKQNNQISVTPDNSVADKIVGYKIYIQGTMTTLGKGGTFTYAMPSTIALVGGKLTAQPLLTIECNPDSNAVFENSTYGSKAIGLVGDRLVYNCKGVCETINVKSATLTVVALDENGKVIGYARDAKTTLNLAYVA